MLLLSSDPGVNSTRVGIDNDGGKSKEDGWSMIDLKIWLLEKRYFQKKIASLNSMMILFDIVRISKLIIKNL